MVLMLAGSSLLMRGAGSSDIDFDKWSWVGFTTILIAFVLIYFAQASYRDNAGGGTISYGKAFRIGLLVSVVASICYVIGWLLISHFMIPDFMEKYQAFELRKLQASGMSEAGIAKRMKEMEDYRKMYANPLINAAITFLEPFPLGVVVSLISAAIVRMKKKTGVPQPAAR